MTNNSTIARNTLLLYIRMLFSLIVSLYTSRVILQVLGVEDYGVYNVVAGFVSMFAFLNGALTSSIQRFFNYEHGISGSEGFRKVYITSVYIQLILAVVALVLVETIGLYYFEHYLVIPENRYDAARVLFHISVISMIIVIMQVPYASAILSKEKMDYYALVGIVDVVLKLLIVYIIQTIPYDRLKSYAWLMMLVSIVDFLLYYIYSRVSFKDLRLKKIFYKDLFISMISFSGWSAFSGFSQIIRHQGINIVLNMFFGPVVNAARGISYQVKSALIGFVGNITMASRPQMVEAYAEGNKDRSVKLMNSTSKLCFIFLLMMSLPITIEVDFVLDLWLKHIVPEHTAFFTVLVLASTLVDILQTPVSMLVYSTGKIAKYNIVTSLIGIAVLPISFYALNLGAEPEIVYVISFFISIGIQGASIFIMSKITGYPIGDYLKNVIGPLLLLLVVTCGFPMVPHFILNVGLVRFFTVCVTSVIVIGIGSYYIALNKEERNLLWSISRSMLLRVGICKK